MKHFVRVFVLNNDQEVLFRIMFDLEAGTYMIVSETWVDGIYMYSEAGGYSKEEVEEVFGSLSDLNAAEFYNSMYEFLNYDENDDNENYNRLA